jgi:hypothetical protein
MLPLAQRVRRADALWIERLQRLEEENERLRRLVADLAQDKELSQDVIRATAMKPAYWRKLVLRLHGVWGVSIVRAWPL